MHNIIKYLVFSDLCNCMLKYIDIKIIFLKIFNKICLHCFTHLYSIMLVMTGNMTY